VAEIEREMPRERVKAGMNQARRVGKHIGRPAGRRLGRAEIDEIRLLRSQGKSVRQLAKEYGASQWMIARLEFRGELQPARHGHAPLCFAHRRALSEGTDLPGLCACPAEEECCSDFSAYARQPRAQPAGCAGSS